MLACSFRSKTISLSGPPNGTTLLVLSHHLWVSTTRRNWGGRVFFFKGDMSLLWTSFWVVEFGDPLSGPETQWTSYNNLATWQRAEVTRIRLLSLMGGQPTSRTLDDAMGEVDLKSCEVPPMLWLVMVKFFWTNKSVRSEPLRGCSLLTWSKITRCFSQDMKVETNMKVQPKRRDIAKK